MPRKQRELPPVRVVQVEANRAEVERVWQDVARLLGAMPPCSA